MDFPSGPWTGFYNYGRTTRKHRMDLVLTFGNHTISGDGSDDIGQFVITGRFDETNSECYWTKAYLAGHDVYYRGFREGKGIWGLWELPNESGGFHIPIMRARKSLRQWKQLPWEHCRGHPPSPRLRRTSRPRLQPPQAAAASRPN
jgi:hypothetical protein